MVEIEVTITALVILAKQHSGLEDRMKLRK